jgi:large subunit ribosomal protein L30
MNSRGKFQVRLDRSLHGRLKSHQACARGLGLRRREQVVEVEDTPSTRGMVRKIQYMVTVLREG